MKKAIRSSNKCQDKNGTNVYLFSEVRHPGYEEKKSQRKITQRSSPRIVLILQVTVKS